MDQQPFLGDLKKRLYEKDGLVENRSGEEFKPIERKRADVTFGLQKKKSFFARNAKFFIISFFIAAVGGAFLYLGLSSFSEQKIVFTIDGQQEITGGDVLSWRVQIANQNRVALQGVKLIFSYPEGSRPMDDTHAIGLRSEVSLDTINPGQTLDRIFKARVLGQENEIKTIRATIFYQLQGISRVLQNDSALQIKVASSPIVLDINAPRAIANNTVGDWTITYKNTSDFDFPQVRLRMKYPKDFTFVSSRPSPSYASNEWGPIFFKAGQEITIHIQGKIQGNPNDQETMEGFVEFLEEGKDPLPLAHKIASSVISLSPLTSNILVNGSASAIGHKGDMLNVVISYENDFTSPIEDVFIEARITGDAADLDSLDRGAGQLDAKKNTIRWDKTNMPSLGNLSLGEKGEVSFNFKVKNALPIKTFADKNFTIQISSRISSDSPPLPFSTQDLAKETDAVILVGSNAILKSEGTFYGEPFNNSGLPPKVGQTTTYAIFWRIINPANDIQDVVIEASLPSQSSFRGVKKINFGQEGFSYDQEKKIISWHLAKIPGTTGVALPTYEAAFQVEVVPTQDQVGKTFDILGKSSLTAKDAFTKEDISSSSPAVRSTLDGQMNPGLTIVTR